VVSEEVESSMAPLGATLGEKTERRERRSRLFLCGDSVGRSAAAGLPHSRSLLDGVAVGVDFVDFANVQFTDAGFDLGHVADHQPN
jgi:hypothetical protein